jgi:hypothetical protein
MKNVKLYLLFIVLINTLLFSVSLNVRTNYFTNTISSDNHQWLTAVTLKFAKNWYEEGALNLKLGMYEKPNSIEYNSLESRDIYPSYLPGCVVPIYFLALLNRTEPNLKMVYYFNAFNQLAISLLLSLFIFFVVFKYTQSSVIAFFSSLLCSAFIFLNPVASYYFLRTYFADTAVIVYFVIFIILEYLILQNSKNKWLWIQGLVAGIGIFTDWLFVFIIVSTIVIRFFHYNFKSQLKNTFILMVFPFLAMLFYLYQMVYFNQFKALAHKFIQRTGHTKEAINKCEFNILKFSDQFWNVYIENGYDKIGKYVIIFTFGIVLLLLVWEVYNRFKNKVFNPNIIFSIALIIVLSIFSQVYFFKCHSVVHNFSIVKFNVLLSIVSFGLLPVLVFQKFEEMRIKKNALVVFVPFMILFSFLIGKVNAEYFKFFPKDNLEYNQVAEFFEKHIKKTDVVFSNNYPIPALPPQQISFTMKEAHLVNNLFEIDSITKSIVSNYDIVFFDKTDNFILYPKDFQELIKQSSDRFESDVFTLFRINKSIFKEILYNKEKDLELLLQTQNYNYEFLELLSKSPEFKNYDSIVKQVLDSFELRTLNTEVKLLTFKFESLNDKKHFKFITFAEGATDIPLNFMVHLVDENNTVQYFDFIPKHNTNKWEKGKLYSFDIELTKDCSNCKIKLALYVINNGEFESKSDLITINVE